MSANLSSDFLFFIENLRPICFKMRIADSGQLMLPFWPTYGSSDTQPHQKLEPYHFTMVILADNLSATESVTAARSEIWLDDTTKITFLNCPEGDIIKVRSLSLSKQL